MSLKSHKMCSSPKKAPLRDIVFEDRSNYARIVIRNEDASLAVAEGRRKAGEICCQRWGLNEGGGLLWPRMPMTTQLSPARSLRSGSGEAAMWGRRSYRGCLGSQ